MKTKRYNVEINGRIWFGRLTEERATYEALRCRRLGLGMAYVVCAGPLQ